MALSDAAAFAVAAWSLDEESGTRADQVGSNTLSDNNTVQSAAGKFGNAADFEALNSESLTRTDNATLSAGDIDFCIRCWVKFESLPNSMSIVSKWGNFPNLEYMLYYAVTSRFVFIVWNGTGTFSVNADNFGNVSADVWYLVHAWHDSVNNQLGISVNGGTANTASHNGGIFDGAANFTIGGGNATTFFDGLIDDVVILKNYILGADERTADYNNGDGVPFADWGSGGDVIIYPANYGLFEGAVFPFGN